MNPYADFLSAAAQYHRDHPQQRRGQAYFNTYAITYPAQANRIRGTVSDPFNRDDRSGAFLAAVASDMEATP